MKLVLTIVLEEGLVRFGSEVANDEPHTIIRELHYPLVGNCPLPADHRLLTTQSGGQLIPAPLQRIVATGNTPPYMAPSQHYRQLDLKYPGHTASNCFAFVGSAQGLYVGSHDPTFQETWHGLRVYPDRAGQFTRLEAGLYKYPQLHRWRGRGAATPTSSPPIPGTGTGPQKSTASGRTRGGITAKLRAGYRK